MRRLWLFVLPLLFTPELSAPATGRQGTEELSDLIVVPYILLAALGGSAHRNAVWRRSVPLLVAFVGWAFLSTLSISVRYPSGDFADVMTGMIKLGKFCAYALAGLLTMRALESDVKARSLFPWSMLACCLVVSVSLVVQRLLQPVAVPVREQTFGYESTNLISVTLAILSASTLGIWIAGVGSNAWRIAMTFCFLTMPLGLAFSNGRGGWVAAVAAASYVAWRFGVRPAFVLTSALACGALLVAYESEARFREQVEFTIDPMNLNRPSDFAVAVGVDDGSRLQTWLNEAPKLLRAPVFGSGLFHRGGSTGLWTSGSHNYWLQMFLETGVVGGTLICLWFRRLWRGARVASRWTGERLSIPAQGALVAAVVGGMSGEYFYGGRALLATLVAVALPLAFPRPAAAATSRPVSAAVALRPVPG